MIVDSSSTSRSNPVKNVLLTGRPGVGKTTLLRRVVGNLKIAAGGFYTEEIREGGARVGFRLRTWEGKSGVLAHVRFEGPPRVGKYGVDPRVMDEIGAPAVIEAIGHARLIAIDELGGMELFSRRFRESVLAALDSPVPVSGVIQDRAHPFLNQVRTRPDVEILRLRVENRSRLEQELRERLEELLCR